MRFLTPLRSLAASTVALAVTATGGLVTAYGPSPVVDVAVPAARDAAALTETQTLEREALITSRTAEREAIQDALMLAVRERNASLTSTSGAIDATEAAIQQQRAAEKAAAEKAAADKAAAAKAAADKAAAEKAAAPRGGSPAANKELGRHLASTLYGWTGQQFTCYDNIIMRESLWNNGRTTPRRAPTGSRRPSPGGAWPPRVRTGGPTPPRRSSGA